MSEKKTTLPTNTGKQPRQKLKKINELSTRISTNNFMELNELSMQKRNLTVYKLVFP